MSHTFQLPSDDPLRHLTVADRNSKGLPHISLAGNTYTILVSGSDTAGRYCLVDMHVPPGGGPPPHRHDFEECFYILAGEVQVTFRSESQVLRAGQTVAIPANAPHHFKNVSDSPAHLLCMCSPAGQEEFFLEVGDRVDSPLSVPPQLSETELKARRQKAEGLAPKYRTELLNE